MTSNTQSCDPAGRSDAHLIRITYRNAAAPSPAVAQHDLLGSATGTQPPPQALAPGAGSRGLNPAGITPCYA